MINKFIRNHRSTILFYLVITLFFGLVYTTIEYFVKINSDDPQQFIPLILRGIITANLIGASIVVFEIFSPKLLINKQFLFVVLLRAGIYTLSIIFWLSMMNGVWHMILIQDTFLKEYGAICQQVLLHQTLLSFLFL